jgi:transcriptional regulator with XRE-family HTH domain
MAWDHARARRVLLPATAAMLAEERRKRGWSLRRAGRAIGCSYETVRLLELRRRVPSTATAKGVAIAYDLPAGAIGRLMAEAVDGAGKSRP